jgi:GT2 family glycosyltransferase
MRGVRLSSLPVDYSIIVVNYNGGSKLYDCVDSVFKFTSNFELFLVDNGSTDGSVSRVASDFPETIVLNNPTNVGFAPANNIAIKRAKGRWIVLLNPDTRVTQSWLDNLVECANNSDDTGIVTPKLLRMDGRTIDSTGHIFDFKTAYAYDRGWGEPDHGQYNRVEEVESCCFACAAIKREVISRIGLLDDKMVFRYEDTDYSIRARIAGWRVVYCPRSIVFHERGGLSPGSGPIQSRWAAYRLRMILKCYSSGNVIRYGALRIARDTISMAAGLKNNDPQYFLSYLRSPIWNAIRLPLNERKLVQSTRKISDKALFSLRSNVQTSLTQ